MPWFLWPMKDVHGHDSRREAATKRLIRRCPNGETHPGLIQDTLPFGREGTRRTEISKYAQEKKSKEIP